MFEVKFATNNDAFTDDPAGAIAFQLCDIARHIKNGMRQVDLQPGDGGTVRDINGNTIGWWRYTPESE